STNRTPNTGGAVERTKFRPTVSGDATRPTGRSQPAGREFAGRSSRRAGTAGPGPALVQSRRQPSAEPAMNVIRLTATSGPDGILHLSVPVGAPGEFEVAVVVSPKPPAGGPAPAPGAKTPEELGWPPGYFENVVGS